MPQLTLSPADSRLQYSGYVNLELQPTRARFNREYGTYTLADYGPANMENGGTRISWRGAAERMTVRLEYTQECRASCSLNLDGKTCYSSGNAARSGSSCDNQCDANLFVDGREVAAPSLVRRDGRYVGLLELELPRMNPPTVERDYMLILPWGAAIDFRGITLSSLAGEPKVSAMEARHPRPLRYVAYGDSISHGFCSLGPSYPELLARLAGWIPVDMGIQGLAAASGAAWGHGHDIAARDPDLVSILIGINDCFGNIKEDGSGWPAEERGETTGDHVRRIIEQLRTTKPTVPVAVITPIVTSGAFNSWRDGAEALRRQTREAVMARVHAGDRNIVVVEGQPLVPPEHMYEGLHPTTRGYSDLATNLYAELGFATLTFTVTTCSPLSLQVSGATPNAQVVVYYSKNAAPLGARTGGIASLCGGRGLQLRPEGEVRAHTDANGAATVQVGQGCDCSRAAWQVLDVNRCLVSRLGHTRATDGLIGTLYQLTAPRASPPPPPPPPPPSPSPPPSPMPPLVQSYPPHPGTPLPTSSPPTFPVEVLSRHAPALATPSLPSAPRRAPAPNTFTVSWGAAPTGTSSKWSWGDDLKYPPSPPPPPPFPSGLAPLFAHWNDMQFYAAIGGLMVGVVVLAIASTMCCGAGGTVGLGVPRAKRRRGQYERGQADGKLPTPASTRYLTMLVRQVGPNGKSHLVEELTLEIDGVRSVSDLRMVVGAALGPLYGESNASGFRMAHERRGGEGLQQVNTRSNLKDILRSRRLQVMLPDSRRGVRAVSALRTARENKGVAGGEKKGRKLRKGMERLETDDIDLERAI